MALLKVRTWPDPVLKTPAKPVEGIDDSVRTLLRDMAETMYAQRGIGLAAQQVGDLRRVLVIDVPGEAEGDPGSGLIQAVNPRIVARSGRCKTTEGCLSFPGLEVDVERSYKVVVEWTDPDGTPRQRECEGLLAICFQHEMDHLDGIVFLDRVGLVRRRLALKEYLARKASEGTP
jgi:peptide deformylase